MSRAGVQFTETQKDMVKQLWESGKTAEAQAIILKELESQFGGAAKAASQTFGGAMKQAENVLGDLKEELGFVITKNEFFVELIHEATGKLGEWTEKIREWRDVNKELIAQKVEETIGKVKDSIEWMVDTYNSLPEGIIGAAGAGLVGRILFGGPKGWLLGLLPLVTSYIEKLSKALSGAGIKENYEEFQKIARGEGIGGPFKGIIPARPVAEAIDILPKPFMGITPSPGDSGGVIAKLTDKQKAAIKSLADEILKTKNEYAKFIEDRIELSQKGAEETWKAEEKLAKDTHAIWASMEKDSEKYTADRLNAYSSMYADLKGYAWDSYNVQVELIGLQAREYERLGVDIATTTRWMNEQIRQTWIASARKSDDFFAGVRAGFMSLQDSVLNWGEFGYQVIVGFASASKNALSTLFMDAIKRELKTFEDYWKSFADSMLNIFVDMLAKMAVEWVTSHIWMSNASNSILGSSAVYAGGGGAGGMLNMASMAGLFGGGAAAAGPGAASWGMEAALGMAGEGGTAAGSSAFMSALGPAALAAGIGYVGGGMLFGEEGQMGSAIGAGIGAAIGSVVPVIGTVIGGVAGGLLGGLLDSIFHEGGMIPYAHSGMFIKPDERLIVGRTGEGIVSRRGMNAIGGESGLNAINKGSSEGSDRPLNISVIVAGEEFTALIARVSDGVRVKAERRGMGVKRIYG